MTKEELTKIFNELGAKAPEEWASSQINEGIPQLSRFLFLKGAWENVVPDNEEWIKNVVKNHKDGEDNPFSGLGESIKKMIECGVPKKYITEFARCIGADMIFHIGYILDDPGMVMGNEYTNWGLFETDEEENALGPISGLHESVLETDPTGREMRPKK